MSEIHYADLETSGKRILYHLQKNSKSQWFSNTPVVTMLCAGGLITIKRTTAKQALCEITSAGLDCYENRNIAQPVVASEPVQRLEDLLSGHPSAIEAIVKLAAETGKKYKMSVKVWEYLFDRGLVSYNEDDANIDTLTAPGAAMVADYQRRQDEAKEDAAYQKLADELNAADTDDNEDSLYEVNEARQAISDKILPPSDFPIDGKKWNDLSHSDQWLEYRQTRIERDALRKELDEARAANVALQNIIDGLFQPSVYGIDSLKTLTYELGRYGATTEDRKDAMATAVGIAVSRLRAK